MQRESVENLPRARVGLASKYRPEAKFVLKLMPDMDRDKAAFDQRVEDQLAAKKKKRWLDRRDFPKWNAGYLYAQAQAFLSGLENLPREMDAIALSDFEFGNRGLSTPKRRRTKRRFGYPGGSRSGIGSLPVVP